jgi:uncharacterized membrane protein
LVASEGDEEGTGADDPRTLALSDGVFAIALTLLVLSLKTPDFDHAQPTASQVGHALLDQHDAFLAWLLSFVVIAMNWLRHRRMFNEIDEVDETTARLNLAYLAAVSFLPFPTDVIARYGSEWPSVVLYSGTIAVLSTLLGLMSKHGRLPGHSRFWWLIPVIMLATIPLSLVVGSSALFLLFLMRLIPA